MPAKHPDVIGYLNDLAETVDQQWFTMICDLAAISGTSTLDKHRLDSLLAIFTERASYWRVKSSTAATVSTQAAASADFLETLAALKLVIEFWLPSRPSRSDVVKCTTWPLRTRKYP